MKTKKIILFIVEGKTDEWSLSFILSKLVKDSNVQFHAINQDITADFNSNSQNIIRKIDSQVKQFLAQNTGLRKSDIKEIIHLVDTDGAFVKEECIVEDMKQEKTYYTINSIITNKKDLILKRNDRKGRILNKLCQINNIGKIGYKVYFFSCNLEHVLHNSQNTACNKKREYSYKFVDQYAHKEKNFVSFLSDNDFTAVGDYKETWQFIKKDCNSLNRYCNFHLYFM